MSSVSALSMCLTETFISLQQVREAEFPVVEVMLILDSFCLCARWSDSLLQSLLSYQE